MPLEGLQRYQIMESLGQGSQGHTYRAIDRRSGDDVAIKVLSLGRAKNWKPFELFEREARVLAGLQHPGIPRYRDYFTSEGSGDYFLVMDLVRGDTLAKSVGKPGSFDEARLRKLMSGVLDILGYLHSRTPPVIHRDIKPGNIILDAGGKPHLVDFGGVRLAAHDEGGSTMIGTYGYMAPEQLHGDAGPGVDLYALGATITALAAGRPADELPHAGLAIDLDALQLPARLRPVLHQLLQPDPRERFKSVAQVRSALSARTSTATHTAPSPASSSRSPGAPDGPKTKRRAAPTFVQPNQPSQALVQIPPIIDELARTPKPISILVWLLALFSAGGLALLEFVALPVLYLVLVAFADRKGRKRRARSADEDIDEDEAGITSLRDLRRETSRSRALLAHVIQGTSPLRDDPSALPPGSNEQD